MFAKLFGTDTDQVLVKIDRNDDGEPEVRIFFTIPEAEETGVCSVGFRYHDNDEGWDNAEAAFHKLAADEVYARKLVKDGADTYLLARK